MSLGFFVNYCIKQSFFSNELKQAYLVYCTRKMTLNKVIGIAQSPLSGAFLRLLKIKIIGFRRRNLIIDSLLFCTEFIKMKTRIKNFVAAADFLNQSKT